MNASKKSIKSIKTEKIQIPPTDSVKSNESPDSHESPSPDSHESPDSHFPIVGIGASAGGLAAFEAFFSGMPTDIEPNMAFVLVQHLAPDHKSILTDIIRRYTHMKVFEVKDGIKVEINRVYIIPPNCDMALFNGTLQLMKPFEPRGQRLPIDFFFRSLAKDQHERAIGIILSGTGSDGTLGIRAIKGEGGMVMAQNPDSTEYDGMPRSAIATTLVDYELPPAEMPAQLMAYTTHAFGKTNYRIKQAVVKLSDSENALKKIFILLRIQTGHDFSQYKPSTIHRRIERRMAINQIETMEQYVQYLNQTSEEVEALFRDVLIGVTNFFRDPEVFKALEDQVIPKLFAAKPSNSVIRVWSTGCSTGEEAYSIAILLAEQQEFIKKFFQIQIFATDIDREAINTARQGVYPASIAADISPERLERFFTPEPNSSQIQSISPTPVPLPNGEGDNNYALPLGTGGEGLKNNRELTPSKYRINKNIRDMLIFSEQDVIKDPPFSKLDLISCRNLLIYMGVELQQKLIPLFNYALKPNGFLLLGNSETIGEFNDIFATIDRKLKIYQRKDDYYRKQGKVLSSFIPPLTNTYRKTHLPFATEQNVPPIKLSFRELTEQVLLEEFAPASVLTNSSGDILYIYGRTGQYLEPASGDASINILKMAREGLGQDLTTALHKSVKSKEKVSIPNISVKTNGNFTTINLTILPVDPSTSTLITKLNITTSLPDLPLYLIIFETCKLEESFKYLSDDKIESTEIDESKVQDSYLEQSSDDGQKCNSTSIDKSSGSQKAININATIEMLKQSIKAKDEYLQATREELETSNEELKSSNEEMQSVNEELQSTNEELETSKEELQSVNEELATVNAELQNKVAELSRANNDMNNLLAGIGIGTVFVDHKLRILRFTPAITKIINLILSDVGRPIGHVVSNLIEYQSLVTDIQSVLDTLIPKELKVETEEGKFYIMRIQPYRTLENVIEGAVITFTGIMERMV